MEPVNFVRMIFRTILILCGLTLLSCAAKDAQYYQTHDHLKSFDSAHYDELSEPDRSEYLEKSLSDYTALLVDNILEWDLPFASGQVDAQLFSDFANLPKNSKIVFFSGGGQLKYSDRIANYIIDNNISLIIPFACMSACAEDLLPAAPELYFFDQPIIGFHGNAHSTLMHLKSKPLPDPCPKPMSKSALIKSYQKDADNQARRYLKTGHNIAFWKEQEKRLSDFSFRAERDENYFCSRLPSYANAEFWLPTSEELRDLLGLEFKGSVCADDPECYRKKLLVTFGPGVSFYIDGKIYTT